MFETTILVHGLIVIIAIGVYFSLYTSTKLYGGIIGAAVRYIGVGILFITISMLERIFVNFEVIENSTKIVLLQDLLNLFGLITLGIGYSKLGLVAKV